MRLVFVLICCTLFYGLTVITDPYIDLEYNKINIYTPGKHSEQNNDCFCYCDYLE